jgi:phage-related protein
MPLVLYPAEIGIGQGSSGGPVAGTQLAVPGGVESILEYNSLLLNVRKWWDTYLVTEIDGLDDADIRDARDQNPVDHGETAFDSYYGGRTITLSGKIRAYSLSKMRDLEQAMRSAFGDLQEHLLVVRGATPAQDVAIYCKKYQKLTIKEAQTDMRHQRDFQVSLRASDPFLMSYLEHYAPVVMAASPSTISVLNAGNFASRPRYKVIGPITNPIILNSTTGKQMKLNGVIAAGQVVEIDVRRKTVQDSAGVNKFSMLDVTSDWATLAAGTNSLQISGTGITAGTTAFQVFWRDTWV